MKKSRVNPEVVQEILRENPFYLVHGAALAEEYHLRTGEVFSRDSRRSLIRRYGLEWAMKSPLWGPDVEAKYLAYCHRYGIAPSPSGVDELETPTVDKIPGGKGVILGFVPKDGGEPFSVILRGEGYRLLKKALGGG